MREVLTDELSARLERLIPAHPRRFRYPGRKRADDRAALEGNLYVARTGIGWIGCPPTCSAATCWRRSTEWYEAGVWQQLHERLLAELRRAGLLDLRGPDRLHPPTCPQRWITPALPRHPVVADSIYGDAAASRQGLTDREPDLRDAVSAFTSVRPDQAVSGIAEVVGAGRPPTKGTYPDRRTAQRWPARPVRSPGRLHSPRLTGANGGPTAA
ncbi:transposase [Actinophytocola xanthii]|uniref:Insertion element IS402-like domain-containing protein n=1 Tax=Actinophytocola xanthii TaxID=1912961 RepID=A0A1Q8CSW9_9PSEU|nr:transposase [Actinophytocola xanthii]OLF17427.1 hypothetical protein BU204_11680 [Actinophytocola xanthii]